jgi:hypothetical protein
VLEKLGKDSYILHRIPILQSLNRHPGNFAFEKVGDLLAYDIDSDDESDENTDAQDVD